MHLLVLPFVALGLFSKLKLNKMKKKNNVLELQEHNSLTIDDIFFFSKIGQELDFPEITSDEQENIQKTAVYAAKD